MRRDVDIEDPRIRDNTTASAVEELVRRLQLETAATLGTGAIGLEELTARITAYVNGWSMSSTDDMITSLALQIAAVMEFGLPPEPLELLRERTSPESWHAAETHYAQHHRLLRRLLRRNYEITQDDLRDRAVRELGVWRGVKELPMDEAPSWLSPTWARGRSRHLIMQPLSCFTSDEHMARTFAGRSKRGRRLLSIVMRATIPAERVLSSAWTGLGVLREQELVILATTGNVEARLS